MGFFGGDNKKEFTSNGKLFEYITTCGDSKKLEDELEKRISYWDIERKNIEMWKTYNMFLLQQLL